MEAVKATDGARAHLIRRAQQLGVPIGVHIDVTWRCDLACVHCYLTERRRAELDLDEYRALFDELRALGTLFLLVSGGEIFHRPDGLEILREATARRFEVRIITHGGHIDAEVARQLAEMGIRVVAMSIYASEPEAHDRVTGVPGSWERTVAAARHLRAVGVPVMLKCVLMTANPGVAGTMREFARSLGAGIEFSVDIKGDNLGSESLLDLNLDLDARIDTFECVYPELVGKEDLPVFLSESHTCLAGNASCYISPDGTVQPCLDWEEPAGNVRERPFGEIWRTSEVFVRARTIRRGSFTACGSCENVSHCSLCPARSLREAGSTTAPAPSKCRETTAKVIGFEARRLSGEPSA